MNPALSVPLIFGQIVPLVGVALGVVLLVIVARIVFSLAWRLVVIGAVVFGLLWLFRAIDLGLPTLG